MGAPEEHQVDTRFVLGKKLEMTNDMYTSGNEHFLMFLASYPCSLFKLY
jgi:hypothetical protein